jgi:transposase
VFPRELKVRAVLERGVSVAQAARDLEIHENVLRRWANGLSVDPMQAFAGHGQEKPERLEIERLRKENAKLPAERDILKKAAANFGREAR